MENNENKNYKIAIIFLIVLIVLIVYIAKLYDLNMPLLKSIYQAFKSIWIEW